MSTNVFFFFIYLSKDDIIIFLRRYRTRGHKSLRWIANLWQRYDMDLSREKSRGLGTAYFCCRGRSLREIGKVKRFIKINLIALKPKNFSKGYIWFQVGFYWFFWFFFFLKGGKRPIHYRVRRIRSWKNSISEICNALFCNSWRFIPRDASWEESTFFESHNGGQFNIKRHDYTLCYTMA